MVKFRLTEARAWVLREIVHGKHAHKEAYGKRSFGTDRHGRGWSTDITRLVAPLHAAGLIKLVTGHNGWRTGWAPTEGGIAALAEYEASRPRET